MSPWHFLSLKAFKRLCRKPRDGPSVPAGMEARMDTGLTIRPAAGTSQFGVREETLPLPKAEPTELAPSKAVAAANPSNKTEALPGSPQRRGEKAASTLSDLHEDPAFESQVIFDTQSREVIYRMVDVNSQRVVTQFPDNALLRLRAYSRAIENGESVIVAMARTDLAT
jgi:hypothetical protein